MLWLEYEIPFGRTKSISMTAQLRSSRGGHHMMILTFLDASQNKINRSQYQDPAGIPSQRE